MSEAVEYARKNGPILMEAMTYRYKGHGVSDKQYDVREGFKEELQQWEERDPITVLRDHLLKNYDKIEPQLKQIEQEADHIVAESIKFAEESDAPDANDLVRNVYVEPASS